MIHQPLGEFQGQATEIDIHARDTEDPRAAERNYGQAYRAAHRKIALDTERDYFMSGEEAKRYGLIDEVITRAPKALKAVASEKDGAKDK